MIRRRVFIEEQGVPAELEVDAHEQTARFYLARWNGKAVGTGRFRVKEGHYLKFERIATLRDARGKGVGSALMERMQADGFADFPLQLQMMHAQIDAVSFYEKLGWIGVGPRFTEAGIEHWMMVNPPAEPGARRALLAALGSDVPEYVRQALA